MDMELPEWLKTGSGGNRPSPPAPHGALASMLFRNERFLDKTLRQVISFAGDTIFNERLSSRRGLLQMVAPKIKFLTILFFIIALSVQKSVRGVAVFSLAAILLVFASNIPLPAFLKRLFPAAAITFFIALPATLNLIVPGDPLFVLISFDKSTAFGPLLLPKQIAITHQGFATSATLFLRVLTSVSFVFLLTMTTPPNAFVKTLSTLVPRPLQHVVSISYRYIFFLVRKVEQFIMGLKSRQITAVSTSEGQRWAGSRIGLLYSMSMELSAELAMAMESRGCGREERFVSHGSRFELERFSPFDLAWTVFSILFVGIMMWKSLT